MTESSNAVQVAVDLVKLGAEVAGKVHLVTIAHGALLQTAVKRHAHEPRTTPRPGPGGPRLLTGAYNRSIGRRTTWTAGGGTVSEVGTNAPQGARLEHGFYGVDSRGRHYSQKAYEHFAPALTEVGPLFEAAVLKASIPGRRL